MGNRRREPVSVLMVSHFVDVFQRMPVMNEINKDIIGHIHALESFGLVDGPGVRFVIFLKGCKMRCKFCHNPDTWNGSGEEWTAEKLFERVRRYKSYWKNNGGITVSGGEPLLQMEFVTALFSLAKKENINTALDTAGQPFCTDKKWLEGFERLAAVTDLFILDLKEMDKQGHISLTGVDNANILEMAEWLSSHGKRMWIRHVLVPGVTDDEGDLVRMREFIGTLETVDRVEILPYHTLGMIKWKELGITYPLEGVPVPTGEQISKAKSLLGIE